jgi:transposase
VAATKVELFEQIRRDSWHGGLSVRALAAKYGVHRRLVREALTRAEPAPRKTPERRSARLEPFKAVIDGWLRADLDAPRKQRHTATRVHARLLDEHAAGDLSYAAVRDYVARRRPEIRIEEGRGPARVFVPQHHPPGMEAEVDFGELWVRLAGVLVKCYLFAFRMSYSGKAVHLVSATCGQEAFLEGHVHAFTVLGGVPAGQIRYDNLTAAVTKVLRKGRARTENPRWTAFRSHYRFAAFYCEPGIEGAHEKGGVEGQVGYFRRNHLVPVPEVDSLAELNARVAAAEDAEDARRIGARIRTIGQDFAAEAPRLVPLPDEPFETGLLLTPRVDRYSQVTVRMNRYSVPVRLIGRQVRVVLRSSELVIYDGRREAARHERMTARGLASKLANELAEAADDKQLTKTIARYGRADLLCIDELGYMELDRRGAELLFQVLTEREEKASVAIASNESFSGWTRTFTDPRLCAAIVDRLTFNATIIETGTESYRLARARAAKDA